MEYDPLESNTHAIKMIMHNIMSQFHQENMISNFKKKIFNGKEYKNIHTVEIKLEAYNHDGN